MTVHLVVAVRVLVTAIAGFNVCEYAGVGKSRPGRWCK